MRKEMLKICWTEIEAMDKEKTVVFIGIAPIEEHGRHLPLGVDIFETEHWMDDAMKQMEADFDDYTMIKMPMVPFGHANMKGIPGNIHLSQDMIYQITHAILNNLVSWGIKHMVVVSGHADPMHCIAIEQACDDVNKKAGIVAFAPMGAIFSDKVSGINKNASGKIENYINQFPNDYHAGWIETSCMMDIRPQLVNESYISQPDIIVSDKEMINPKCIMEKTKGFGHLGYPKHATRELGICLNQDTSEKICFCVSRFIKRKGYEPFVHHELYRIPFLRVKRSARRV